MIDYRPQGDVNGNIPIYFNEEKHEYTDDLGNKLNSVTTIISEYYKKFDTDKMARICSRIGKDPRHPKYLKYKGKTEKQLKAEWLDTTNKALDKGNKKHNYLEDVIKSSNNYSRVSNKFINDKIFTIPDIIKNPSVGLVDIKKLNEFDISNRYPKIYELITTFINDGWKLYAEIGVYNIDLLVSGLVDLLLVKGDRFIIIDWKTNKSPIRFESGYYEKDNDGNITDRFIKKEDKLLYPLNHLADSVGNKYSLQLSTYSYLIEKFNLKYTGTILCHIRTNNNDEDEVDFLDIKYMKDSVINMLEHYYSKLTLNNQNKLFL